MSSHYTTISCEEWQRMQDAINNVDAYVIHNDAEIQRLQNLERERKERLNRILQINGHMVEDAVNYITLSGRNNAVEMDEKIRADIESKIGEMSSTLSGLRQSVGQSRQRISGLSGEIHQIARQYDSIIQEIVSNISNGRERAQNIRNELERILNEIRNLHPEVFAPASFSSLESNYRMIVSSMEQGDYQAALQLSQGSFIDAGTLLTELILDNERFGNDYEAVAEGINSLMRRMDGFESSEGIISLETEDGESEIPYDIGYWSNGIYGEIKEEIEHINSRIAAMDSNPVPLDDIHSIADQISRMDDQLTLCDTTARGNLASSIAVESMAQRIYDALSNQGLDFLDGTGHEGDDSRNPYAMICQDASGNQMSMVISQTNDPDKPAFFVEGFSDTEEGRSIIMDTAESVLQADGMESGSIGRREDCSENTSPEAFVQRINNERAVQARQRAERARQSIRQNRGNL